MLCEQILGTLSDEQFKNLKVDYVDIEWHEAFKKLHKKTSKNGVDVLKKVVTLVSHWEMRF